MDLALVALDPAALALILAGVALAGAGLCGSFSGAFRELVPRATPSNRAGLLATVHVESDLAFSLPVILAGLAAPHLGLLETADAHGLAVSLRALTSGTIFRRRSKARGS